MAKTLQQTVQNWTNSAGTAQADWLAGVQATQNDPTQAAIQAQGRMLAGFQQAVTSGRWAANLSAVGMQGWKAASVAKAPNYGQGIAAGQAKYNAAMTTWLPRIESAAAAARAIPATVGGPNNARSAAFATALYNAKRGL